MWEAASEAIVFGVVMGLAVLAAFRYAASLVEKVVFAAFTHAEKEYKEVILPRARRTMNQMDGAISVDDALYGKKGRGNPVPDIPPHPGNLGSPKDPTNWTDNLSTERVRNRG